MRFLLDQGVPRTAVAHLRDLGHACEHVADIGMAKAEDPAIIQRACEDAAVIVTFDADFHELLAAEKASEPSVIRIREEKLKGAETAALVAMVVRDAAEELEAGAVVSATTARFRCRRLPITR